MRPTSVSGSRFVATSPGSIPPCSNKDTMRSGRVRSARLRVVSNVANDAASDTALRCSAALPWAASPSSTPKAYQSAAADAPC